MIFMTDDTEIEILSRAIRIYVEWANKTIPGFQTLLSSLQDELDANSVEAVVRKAVLDPHDFYKSLAKHVGSPIVADSYLYLLVSSFIIFFKLPVNASDVIKAVRKGKWEEWKKKVINAASMLSGKI
ncbi:MAG: hypothetical protein QXZ14_02305 [Candidatus Jordarchaeales archaeon]